jgi:tetratricopeptide (TPR) repeat protein
MHDRFQGSHSTEDAAAVAAFERAVAAVAAHRPLAGPALDEAVAHDPAFVAAHALKGFAALMLGRAELLGPAADAARAARAALGQRAGPTRAEDALVRALEAAVAGRFLAAAVVLEARLRFEPLNFLLLKLSHALRFMAGDAPGMLAATAAVLPEWRPDAGGAGYVYGCHAFALEEAGQFRAAERFGDLALALAPDDAWGLHAVSHVDEMEGRVSEGIARLEGTRSLWSRCNNFQFHMAWHLALLHLEAGEGETALHIYDDEIRPQPTDDYRDVANAASLLWRLKLAGIGVAGRWDELIEIGKRRTHDTTLVFASLHYLLALSAAGERSAARATLEAWRDTVAQGAGDQARTAGDVGLDLARVIVGEDGRRPDYAGIARRLPAIGGSNAQRDVFLQTLAHRARDAEDWRALGDILAVRRQQRWADTFERRMGATVQHCVA